MILAQVYLSKEMLSPVIPSLVDRNNGLLINNITNKPEHSISYNLHIEGWAQDYSNSNIFLKPLFRGNLDPFVNNANLGAIAHTSNGT